MPFSHISYSSSNVVLFCSSSFLSECFFLQFSKLICNVVLWAKLSLWSNSFIYFFFFSFVLQLLAVVWLTESHICLMSVFFCYLLLFMDDVVAVYFMRKVFYQIKRWFICEHIFLSYVNETTRNPSSKTIAIRLIFFFGGSIAQMMTCFVFEEKKVRFLRFSYNDFEIKNFLCTICGGLFQLRFLMIVSLSVRLFLWIAIICRLTISNWTWKTIIEICYSFGSMESKTDFV